jgi:hypothetical protein
VLSADCANALRAAGFKRIEGPRKTLDALLDVAQEKGVLRVVTGLRKIAEFAACSAATVKTHLGIFHQSELVEINPTDFGTQVDLKFVLSHPLPYLNTPPNTSLTVDQCSDTEGGTSFYHDHKADDAFISYPYGSAMKRRAKLTGKDTVLADSFGPGAALLWHLLEEHGLLCDKEAAEIGGMSLGSVATSRRKLERAGLLIIPYCGEGARKYYELHPNAEERLDERRPEMKSYGVGLRRQLHHAEDQLKIARRQGKFKRVMRLEDKYNALHWAAHGDTGDENPAFWVRGRIRKRSSRWDTWERQRQIDALQAVYHEVHDLPVDVQRRWLGEAGYTEDDITLIVTKRVFMSKLDSGYNAGRIPKDQQVQRPPGLQPEERADLWEWIAQRAQYDQVQP